MKQSFYAPIVLVLALVSLALGCAGADDETAALAPDWELVALDDAEASRGADASVAFLDSEPYAEPAPPPGPTPAPEMASDDKGRAEAADGGFLTQAAAYAAAQQTPQTQDRIIVQTATMAVVVDDVPRAMQSFAGVARELNGWVVSLERQSASHGYVAVRVPADVLGAAMERIAGMSVREESRAVSSQDVTEEFVDSESRLTNLRATQQRLLSFLEKAEDAEDALLVHRELTLLEEEIELIQGRLNALRETAAYSLLQVNLRIAPINIAVSAGDDDAARVGELVRFTATFDPVPGIENFTFTWDFGDGGHASGSGSALTPDGKRVTSTVSHAYGDHAGSPYIVSFTLSGSGEGGIVEGSDTLLMTVLSIPHISIFAGGDRRVAEGEEIDYSVSFTRPEGLRDFEYRWDFGDGSASAQGEPEEGATRVTVSHAYDVYHPDPYPVRVTVSAVSEAGPVTATAFFHVSTTPAEGLIVEIVDLGAAARAAVRALSVVAQGAVVAAIWAAVFLPVVAALAVGGRLVWRRALRRRRPAQLSPEDAAGAV